MSFRTPISIIAAVVLAVLALFCVMPISAVSAYASETTSTTAVIPVSQYCTPDGAPTVTLTYEMKPVTVDAPMPEGTVDGVYTWKMTDASQSDIVMEFSKPGVYEYRMECVSPADNWKLPYSFLNIGIYVANNGSGGLDAAVIITNADGEKDISARWEATYGGMIYLPPVVDNVPPPSKDLDRTGDVFPVATICVCLLVALVSFALLLVRRRKEDK